MMMCLQAGLGASCACVVGACLQAWCGCTMRMCSWHAHVGAVWVHSAGAGMCLQACRVPSGGGGTHGTGVMCFAGCVCQSAGVRGSRGTLTWESRLSREGCLCAWFKMQREVKVKVRTWVKVLVYEGTNKPALLQPLMLG